MSLPTMVCHCLRENLPFHRIDRGRAARYNGLVQERCMGKTKSVCKELLVRNPDVVLREEGPDGALIFNPDTNQVRVINATGLFIWKQCDGNKDLPAIVTALKNAFDAVPESKVREQANEFICDLRAGGFLGLLGEKIN